MYLKDGSADVFIGHEINTELTHVQTNLNQRYKYFHNILIISLEEAKIDFIDHI